MVRSLANGGGNVSLGTDSKGHSVKGTFSLTLEATGGFTENDGDGLMNDPVEGVYEGHMNYHDHQTKGQYKSSTIDSISVDKNGVIFSGSCRSKAQKGKWSDDSTYSLTIVDNGEPGSKKAIESSKSSNNPDTFSLSVTTGHSFFLL